MKFAAYDSIGSLPSAYDELFAAASRTSLYLGKTWFETFARTTLGPGERIRLCSVEAEDGRPLALLVARAARSGPAKMLSSMTNFYTMEFAPLLRDGFASSSEALLTLASGLFNDRPRWSVLTLNALDRHSDMFRHLTTALRSAGYVVHPCFQFGNWYEKTAGLSFEEYFRSRPSVLRNTYRRRHNSLEKSGKAKYLLFAGTAGLEDGIEAYGRIYASSWKTPERYPDFIPEMMRACARSGHLRLGILQIEGEPAAAQVWLVNHGRATIYKLAYDERFKQLSVGTLLTAHLMRHVIDVDRVAEVDYGSGDDSYKQDWMSSRRERWGLTAYNPRTVRGALEIGNHFGRSMAKRLAASFDMAVGRKRREDAAVKTDEKADA
jgi:CelD/BcsL family acetyltransferase involved in cellulose biosynthesis